MTYKILDLILLFLQLHFFLPMSYKCNFGCHTQEEVHEYMGRILGKPLDVSTTVLPPFYIDYVFFTSIVQTRMSRQRRWCRPLQN